MTHADAIARLRERGHEEAANFVANWLNVENTRGGWDAAFKKTYPKLIDELWPPSADAPGASMKEATPTRAAKGRNLDAPEYLALGVDVGGDRKGLHLCFLEWRGGQCRSIRFSQVSIRTPIPDKAAVQTHVAQGDIHALAKATYASARDLIEDLRREIGSIEVNAIYIDAPSAFSRNKWGHGRATEKWPHPGRAVTFQSTPSISCGKAHNADWVWIVYGMATHASPLCAGGGITEPEWRAGLQSGFHTPSRALAPRVAVRECFPTATIEHLRSIQKSDQLEACIRGLDGPAVDQVRNYLTDGMAQKNHSKVPDEADALIAALGSVAFAREDWGEKELWPCRGASWEGSVDGAMSMEGVIVVPT